MATVIGLDLGTHSVKATLVEGRLNSWSVAEVKVRGVPQDAENAPDPQRVLAAAAALLDEIDEPGILTVGFPTQRVSTRTVTLPFTDRGQIDKTLPFELEGHVPFDLEDFVLGYRIQSTEGSRSKVLAALAEKAEVGALIAGLAGAGGDPRHVVIDGELLALHAPASGVHAVVDLGHSRTLVALVEDGKVLATRAISLGGRNLTLAICEEHGLDWGEAEGQKHATSVMPAGRTEVQIEWDDDDVTRPNVQGAAPGTTQVVQQALLPLLARLRATILGMETEHDLDIEELVVVGGTACLDGLPELMADDFGLIVRRAHISDEAELAGEAPRFALSHAFALRSIGATKGQELELRRDEFAYKGDLARVKQFVAACSLMLGVFAVAAVVIFIVRFLELSEQRDALADEVVATVMDTFPDTSESVLRQSNDMPRAVVAEKSLEAAERLHNLGATVGGDPPTLTLMKELSQALPTNEQAEIEVQDLTITTASMKFEAMTTGFEAAATIESKLKQHERFAGAKKGKEVKKGDGLEFTVTIPLTDAEASEEG